MTSALVTLINCCSNLDNLELSSLLHEVDGDPSSLCLLVIWKFHISERYPRSAISTWTGIRGACRQQLVMAVRLHVLNS